MLALSISIRAEGSKTLYQHLTSTALYLANAFEVAGEKGREDVLSLQRDDEQWERPCFKVPRTQLCEEETQFQHQQTDSLYIPFEISF